MPTTWRFFWPNVVGILGASLVASSLGSNGTSTIDVLNTLTTSCNGGCSSSGTCVVVGQSSPITVNCVNNTNCVTLSSGQSALCLGAFDASATQWIFQPANNSNAAGTGPFDRIGLLQLYNHVADLAFSKADESKDPLYGSLELASMNIQPSATLNTVAFRNLKLSGLDNALPLNNVKQIYFNNCSLSEIPTAVVAGDYVTTIDLAGNAITEVNSTFGGESFTNLTLLDLSSNALNSFNLVADKFPAIKTLYLHDNLLEKIPNVIFQLSTLQILTLAGNPINSSDLTAQQFTFLANLQTFTIDNTTNTSVCPTKTVQSALTSSFRFCVDGNDYQVSNGSVTERPVTTVPATTEENSSSTSSHRTWVIIGVCLGAVALLVCLLGWWWLRLKNEKPKPANCASPSIAIGMGELSNHPYMELGVLHSNTSSRTASDFELLASVADGYIGIARLSYDDILLHKMLRVSSRSELWLGEYEHEAVLVKKLKSNTASKAQLRDFVTEIELMFQLKHPRVAAFRGAMWDADGTELCAVVEYVEKGALRDCTIDNTIKLSIPNQHAIAHHISDALAYLHSHNIVHGRLNAFNILLDKDYSAKLSLFSIFHYVKLSPLDNECKIFVAPEIQRGEQPTEKTDVYAFGVVLVEIDTGETPIMNARRLSMERPGAFSPLAQKIGFRLSNQCSRVMKETITACLEKDPSRRPAMADVAFAFRASQV